MGRCNPAVCRGIGDVHRRLARLHKIKRKPGSVSKQRQLFCFEARNGVRSVGLLGETGPEALTCAFEAGVTRDFVH